MVRKDLEEAEEHRKRQIAEKKSVQQMLADEYRREMQRKQNEKELAVRKNG